MDCAQRMVLFISCVHVEPTSEVADDCQPEPKWQKGQHGSNNPHHIEPGRAHSQKVDPKGGLYREEGEHGQYLTEKTACDSSYFYVFVPRIKAAYIAYLTA